MCMYTQRYNLQNALSIAWMHMCLSLTTWGLFLENSDFSLSQKWLTVCSSSSRSGPLWGVQHSYWHMKWWYHHFCLDNHIVEISWVWSLCYIYSEHYLVASILVLWFLQSFRSLFYDVPWTLGVCAVDVYTGVGHPMVSCFLHFKYLRLSVMICACCKCKLVW